MPEATLGLQGLRIYIKRRIRKGLKLNFLGLVENKDNWIKEEFNGHIKNSKPMPIIKEYGEVELSIIDEGVFGLRLI